MNYLIRSSDGNTFNYFLANDVVNYRAINYRSRPLTGGYLSYLYDLSNPTNTDCGYCCLPKGTICITVSLRGRYSALTTSGWQEQSQTTVFGLIKRQQFLLMPPNYREITIGFYPHVFQQLIRGSMAELSDSVTTDLTLLLDKYAVEQLVAGLFEATTDSELLLAIESFLVCQLQTRKKELRLDAAHKLILNSSIRSVDSLSSKLNLSPGRLREIYHEKVGFTPKEALRIARIKKALERRIDSEERLTDLAYDLGYFDQSHFIHDFQTLIGLTPKQYFKNPNLTSDFYNYSRLQLSSFVA